MGLYKLMFNSHTDYTTGKTYKKGDVIESEMELDKIFLNRFQKVASKSKKVDAELGPEEFLKQQQFKDNSVGLAQDQELDDRRADTTDMDGSEEFDDKGKVNKDKKEPKDAEPKDVTDKFKTAKKADLKVFQDGEGFVVTDADDKKNKPLNKKKLSTEHDVEHFIKTHK